MDANECLDQKNHQKLNFATKKVQSSRKKQKNVPEKKVVPKKRNSKVEFHWNLQVKNGIGIYLKSGIVHFYT